MINELFVRGSLASLRLREDLAGVRAGIQRGIGDGDRQRHFRFKSQRHGKLVAEKGKSAWVRPTAGGENRKISANVV